MRISSAIPQLRTTDLDASIRFYTGTLGFALEFRHEDFYAAIRAGGQVVHLKLVDERDPTIDAVSEGEHFHLYLQTDDATAAAAQLQRDGVALVRDVHETTWGTREFVIHDNQGHTLYFSESTDQGSLAIPTADGSASAQATDLAIPTLPSRSLPATLAFYANLGFAGRVLGAEDSYAILTRGSIELHFFAHPALDPEASHAGCYVRVQDADALHDAFAAAALATAGISRLDDIADRPWGMREFAMVDPDGNLLRVGQVA